MRLRTSALRGTLAAQLVSRLRHLAIEAGATAIRVGEPHLDESLAQALHADGFLNCDDRWIALSLPGVCRASGLSALLAEAASDLLPLESSALVSTLGASHVRSPVDLDPTAWIALERRVRPLHVLDAPCAAWLVPIKPAFASDLFGYPHDLFGRSDELGLSVEHVYYRGGRSGESAPSRILWYVSGKSHGLVFASSELTEVVDGSPKALYSRFRRLGTYSYGQVAQCADKKGSVRALRVLNTEVLPSPVPLGRLRALAQAEGQALRLVSASKISGDLFAAIMAEGHRGQ